MLENVGRGKRIRTSGLCLPKAALYQAELSPDRMLMARKGPRQERAYSQ